MPDRRLSRSMQNNDLPESFRLQGDKIKLEQRPTSRSSASSKCSYLSQGPSRPVSALPALNLYRKNDFQLEDITRRPSSAPFRRKKSSARPSSRQITEAPSLESIEEDHLPSSEVYQSLISEPIKSYRGISLDSLDSDYSYRSKKSKDPLRKENSLQEHVIRKENLRVPLSPVRRRRYRNDMIRKEDLEDERGLGDLLDKDESFIDEFLSKDNELRNREEFMAEESFWRNDCSKENAIIKENGSVKENGIIKGNDSIKENDCLRQTDYLSRDFDSISFNDSFTKESYKSCQKDDLVNTLQEDYLNKTDSYKEDCLRNDYLNQNKYDEIDFCRKKDSGEDLLRKTEQSQARPQYGTELLKQEVLREQSKYSRFTGESCDSSGSPKNNTPRNLSPRSNFYQHSDILQESDSFRAHASNEGDSSLENSKKSIKDLTNSEEHLLDKLYKEKGVKRNMDLTPGLIDKPPIPRSGRVRSAGKRQIEEEGSKMNDKEKRRITNQIAGLGDGVSDCFKESSKIFSSPTDEKSCLGISSYGDSLYKEGTKEDYNGDISYKNNSLNQRDSSNKEDCSYKASSCYKSCIGDMGDSSTNHGDSYKYDVYKNAIPSTSKVLDNGCKGDFYSYKQTTELKNNEIIDFYETAYKNLEIETLTMPSDSSRVSSANSSDYQQRIQERNGLEKFTEDTIGKAKECEHSKYANYPISGSRKRPYSNDFILNEDISLGNCFVGRTIGESESEEFGFQKNIPELSENSVHRNKCNGELSFEEKLYQEMMKKYPKDNACLVSENSCQKDRYMDSRNSFLELKKASKESDNSNHSYGSSTNRIEENFPETCNKKILDKEEIGDEFNDKQPDSLEYVKKSNWISIDSLDEAAVLRSERQTDQYIKDLKENTLGIVEGKSIYGGKPREDTNGRPKENTSGKPMQNTNSKPIENTNSKPRESSSNSIKETLNLDDLIIRNSFQKPPVKSGSTQENSILPTDSSVESSSENSVKSQQITIKITNEDDKCLSSHQIKIDSKSDQKVTKLKKVKKPCKSADSTLQRGKFEAKQIKSYKELPEVEEIEIDSWMSQNKDEESSVSENSKSSKVSSQKIVKSKSAIRNSSVVKNGNSSRNSSPRNGLVTETKSSSFKKGETPRSKNSSPRNGVLDSSKAKNGAVLSSSKNSTPRNGSVGEFKTSRIGTANSKDQAITESNSRIETTRESGNSQIERNSPIKVINSSKYISQKNGIITESSKNSSMKNSSAMETSGSTSKNNSPRLDGSKNSKSTKEPASKETDVDQWLSNSMKKGPNYLDLLDSLEDMENNVKPLEKEGDVADMEKQSNGSTYDEIVSILEVLEAEDKKSHQTVNSIQQMVSKELVTTDLQDKLDFRSDSSGIDTGSTNRNTPVSPQKNNLESSLNSSVNYNDILSYLDEVDRKCTKTITTAKENIFIANKIVESTINMDTMPRLDDLRGRNIEDLSNQIIELNIRLKDKASSVRILQEELSSLRDQVLKSSKNHEKVLKEKLSAQKDEYEGVVKRHQKFIDQLIADKKSLNQQCESLINEMKVLEDRYNTNLRAVEQRHKVEMQKLKEMQVAGEKMRRERWIDTKTQKIKEMTVKSLEPELQSMATRQQQEISELRSLHKKEIEELELRAARKTQQQCESLREQMSIEREKALAHERELMRQRYENLVESEEKGYQEQRRRLNQEHTNRIAECEEREAAAVVEKDRAIKQAQEEFEEKLKAATRKHSNEIQMLKEKTEIEMEIWRNNYKKQQNVQLTESETKIREQFRKERDKEIESVIERLETEAVENKMQIEQTTENRIRRLKEKYEKEIKDLEASESEAKNKYNDTKIKLLEMEEVVVSLRGAIKQMENHLKETKEVSEKLTQEKLKLKEIVRAELKEDVDKLEKEIIHLKVEKEKELQQVYSRVRVAVAKKDEMLQDLTRDHQALKEKCMFLENMIEQQRKDYLIK